MLATILPPFINTLNVVDLTNGKIFLVGFVLRIQIQYVRPSPFYIGK